MNIKVLVAVVSLSTLVGCAGSKVENPVDYVTYSAQPLVDKVDHDMTSKEVMQIAGPPSSTIYRSVEPGTCNNYVLSEDNHKQPYYVSFNSSDRVDGKGFMTCEQMEKNARATLFGD